MVERAVNQLEALIQEDRGQRGFPCVVDNPVPTETDGPSGAVAIAKILIGLGKRAQIVTDASNYQVMVAAVRASGFADSIPVKIFPSREHPEQVQTFIDEFFGAPEEKKNYLVDHLVAIERAGPGPDGGIYTMKAVDISWLCADVHKLFEFAAHHPQVRTTGIGDGGNEVGMGKVLEAVKAHIPNGPKICNVNVSDHLITAGVSNWGGYALAFSLFALQKIMTDLSLSDADRRVHINRLLTFCPSREQEYVILAACVAAGAADGMSKKCEMSVDGIEFEYHAKVIEAMRTLVSDSS